LVAPFGDGFARTPGAAFLRSWMDYRGVHRDVLASQRSMLSDAVRIDSRIVLATAEAADLNDTNALTRPFRLCANMM
jgi:hypothetical protein